ncbi:amino acid/polyamine/organocation transporter (APC superfamily) [Microbacterium sp. AG790]|uniref:APC family permease n=1 Tax=Microbacterium sp. AG790 TaxID=2183995 RepID=UPI000EB109D1|nr:APC family permease [Microbacterium sp. AG790]RKS93508.1 amino acid/polyamine/organocation transporter (APC superfamily) [Microbacterium sp. AG790]
MSAPAALARRLGLVDAIAIGLGSMIGAGVFAAFAPAAAAAGSGLLIGLALAAVVAYANATSSAQLAAQFPTSGGTYVYGREMIGPWSGFFAGWSFVIGKTASCAAMALTFASYAAPAGWEKPVAVMAVLVLAAVNTVGVTRTAALTKVIVVVVLAVLALVVVAASASSAGSADNLVIDPGPHGWYGVLQSAGLLFFAFAGYARIATMGEEVRDPRRTIPRAIVIALSLALLVYVAIALVSLATLGPERLAASSAPLAEVAAAGGWTWTAPVVRVGAAAASLGALLALVAGIGRTSLAMARTGDLPQWLSAVHPRYAVPHRAELVLAAVVSLLIVATDLRSAIGFSSFGVLLYYLVANIAAFRQDAAARRFPRALQIVGMIGCVVLVATLPWPSIVGGVVVACVGVGYRALRLRRGMHP